MIFVLPPNADTLKERLVGRQTETMEVINKRLSKAAEETGVIDKYDYFVINDEIADCAARINDIVTDNNPELIGSDCVNKIKNQGMKNEIGEKGYSKQYHEKNKEAINTKRKEKHK